MNTLLQADIFFFITSVAVIALAVMVLLILVYVLKIVRDVRYTAHKMRELSDLISGDVGEMRTLFRANKLRPKHFKEFMQGIFSKQKKSKRTKATRNNSQV